VSKQISSLLLVMSWSKNGENVPLHYKDNSITLFKWSFVLNQYSTEKK